LCIHIAFLPRDECIARPMPSCGVCLPAWCQSRSRIVSKRVNIIVNSPYQTHHFLYLTLWQYSNGDPQLGRRMQVVYEKIAIFDQYLALVNDTR